MRYCLMIDYGYHDYIEVTGYSKTPGFDYLDEKKLPDIVEFTSSFIDKEDLYNYLKKYNLIKNDSSHYDFFIGFYRNKDSALRPLPYDVSYENETRFYDPSYIINYYNDNLENGDLMKSFLANLYTNYVVNSNEPTQTHLKKQYLSLIAIKRNFDFFQEYGYYPNEDSPQEDNINYMDNFLKLFIYNKSKDGKIRINYVNLRYLAMIAINYERRKNKTYGVTRKNLEEQANNLKTYISHLQEMLNSNYLLDEERERYEDTLNDSLEELDKIYSKFRGGRS